MRRFVLAICVLSLAACGSVVHRDAQPVAPTTTALAKAAVKAATPSGASLQDFGGPIVGAANVHVLWWGSSFPDQTAVNGFMPAFVGSDYVAIANEYERGGSVALTLADTSYDTGSSPAHNVRYGAVKTELVAKYGTLDPHGLYVVLGDTYGSYGDGGACAWHDFVTVSGTNIPIVYVPNDFQAGTPSGPAQCAATPPFYFGAWGYGKTAANRIAHETLEAVTDTEPCTALTTCSGTRGDVAWATSATGSGQGEIADLCVGSYGNATLTDSTVWFLQGEWSNATSACVWH